MAIEPAGIIAALQTSKTKEEAQATLQLVYLQLPTCIQRAVATLQCAQLEKDYRQLANQWKVDFAIDLPAWMREKTLAIMERRR